MVRFSGGKSINNDNIKLIGVNTIEDKAVFFENWHINFINWANTFAQSIAFGEDISLFETIFENCQLSNAIDLISILNLFDQPDSIFIITSGISIWNFFEKQPQYKNNWNKPNKKLDINGFEGWFEYKNTLIPIFSIPNTGHDNTILILDKNQIGDLYQYSPLMENDTPSLQKDIFKVNIQELTNHQDLMNKFIQEQPDWLRTKGGHEQQLEFLKERVLIEIYEKFELIISDHFYGYKWNPNNTLSF